MFVFLGIFCCHFLLWDVLRLKLFCNEDGVIYVRRLYCLTLSIHIHIEVDKNIDQDIGEVFYVI